MSAGTSVGVISLDLVIKEKLTSQLEKIKSDVQADMRKPVEQAAQAVEGSIEGIGKAAGSAAARSSAAWRDAFDEFKARFEAQQERMESAATETVKPKTVTYKIAPEYDPKTVSAQVDKLTEDIAERTRRAAEKVRSSLSENRVPANGLERFNTELDSAHEKLGLTQAKFGRLQSALSEVFEGGKIAAQKSFSGISAAAKGTFNAVTQNAAAPFNAIKNAARPAFSFIRNVGSKAIDNINGKFKAVNRSASLLTHPVSKFANSLKNSAKRIFLMAGVLAVFRSIRSAVSDTVKKNDEFSRSLNEIKANLNIAFQPIITAVMPAINTLMEGLAAASKAIAAFTAEIFGTTYQKSLDTVKKLKQVGSEAKKNSTYLAAFDEMNVAQDTSESSSSDSSEDSAIDYPAIDPNYKLPDWAEKMKDAIRSGDWRGVGTLLAQKVNGAFDKIDWDNIKAKIKAGAKSLADGLNSFVDGVNWYSIGSSLGEGMNTALEGLKTFLDTFNWEGLGRSTAQLINGGVASADWSLLGATLGSKFNAAINALYGFVTTFDFSRLGASLGTSVNSLFDTVDFSKAGKTLSGGVKGLLDTALSFVYTVKWSKIGEKIYQFLSSIDWAGISRRVFELLGAALGAAVSLLWGFIKNIVDRIQQHFEKEFDRMDTGNIGADIILGILVGIGDAIIGIGRWIKDNIFTPFINGFKKAFDINSPSKVMEDQGTLIIQGLINGVTNKITDVVKSFKKLLAKVKGVFSGIPAWFAKTFGSAVGNIKMAFRNIPIWLREKFESAWNMIRSKFSLSNVSEHFNSIKNKIVDIFGGLKEALKTPLNWVIDLINSVIDKLNGFSIDIPDWVPEFGGGRFGFDISPIPPLAKGGLAKAPTLAMVGDNPHASSDPEVIAPLSKLKDMLPTGEQGEIASLLREIITLLRGLDLTVVAKINDRVLFETVRQLAAKYKRRTGADAF